VKIPVQKLKAKGLEPFEFTEQVDVSDIQGKNDIRRIDPVKVSGQATSYGNDITVKFAIDGKMILPCARTLVDVPYEFHIETTELFTLSPYASADDESEIHPIEGELLDLKPYIEENILLDVPFRVFSDDPQALDNAAKEGEGWQLASEKAQQDKIDPRLEKLQALLKKDDE
jgi:uncharacterized protein